MFWKTTVIGAILAIQAWRWLPIAMKLLVPIELPSEYFAFGNATEQCRLVRDETEGKLRLCEHLVMWKRDGYQTALLLLSCDSSRHDWNPVTGPMNDPTRRGALWGYDQSDNTLKEIALIGFPEQFDFHPLGIDIFTDADKTTLFAVNLGRNRSTIEQFSLFPQRPFEANYVRTLSHRFIVSPNAIATTSASSFFLTQDHLFTMRIPYPLGYILATMEAVLVLPFGWMNHVNVDEQGIPRFSWPVRGVPFANGVAISPKRDKLVVASSSQGRIFVYHLTGGNKLEYKESIDMPHIADNLSFDEAGLLYVAGHPWFQAIEAVRKRQTAHAGSWVVSVDLENTTASDSTESLVPFPATRRANDKRIRTVYQSNGHGYSTSTTAVKDVASNTLFVVGLFGDGMLSCTYT